MAVSPQDPPRPVANLAGPEVTTDHARDPARTTDVTKPQTSPEPFDATLPAVPGYVVTREIARGGMGRVLAGHDLTLDREVAIKVLLPGRTASEAARRFVLESKITAKLPHPNIPPVHQLGTLADGSPFLAMKLIEGRTLADLLTSRERKRLEIVPPVAPVLSVPDFIGIFEQICQAVGFAHGRGVIHRDLKPANVMVGSFGEVQVMDWGLAREMRNADCGMRKDDGVPHSAIPIANSEMTQAGATMGTPAYMAPEQARGEAVDARADVFGLGAILCEILTGHRVFNGKTTVEMLFNVASGNVTPAFLHLDNCGVDAELIAAAKQCLNPERDSRPANAGALAKFVAEYRAGVEARLRTAERQRAAADAKAIEQRKRRRVQLALAAAVGLLVLAGAGFGWWADHQANQRRLDRERADGALKAEQAAFETDRTLKVVQARERTRNLLAIADKSRKDYRYSTADHSLREAGKLIAGIAPDLEAAVEEAKADLAFVREVDAIRMKRSMAVAVAGGKTHFDEATAPKAYRGAFASRGMEVVANPERVGEQVAASAIRNELVTALDDWSILEKEVDVRDKLLAVLRRADPNSGAEPFRDPAAWNDPAKLKKLTADANAAQMTPGTVIAIAQVMRRRRLDPAPLLRHAMSLHPREFLLTFCLAQFLYEKDETDIEAIGAYRAARAIRPDNATLLNNLGIALHRTKDTAGAIVAYREAIRINSKFALPYINLGNALRKTKDYDGAIAAFKVAIRLDPTLAYHHFNLGTLLHEMKDFDGAIAALREAIRVDPKYAVSHYNLGVYLNEKNDLNGAIAAYREAVRLDLKFELGPRLYSNLGVALQKAKNVDGAIAAQREAIRISPQYAVAHYNLGIALTEKNDLDGSIAAYKEAVRINPKFMEAYHNLGTALRAKKDFPGSLAAYEKAVELAPELAIIRINMASLYSAQDKYPEAVACARKAIACDPTLATAHAALGFSLQLSGDIPGARAAFTEATRIDPKRFATWLAKVPRVPVAPPPRKIE